MLFKSPAKARQHIKYSITINGALSGSVCIRCFGSERDKCSLGGLRSSIAWTLLTLCFTTAAHPWMLSMEEGDGLPSPVSLFQLLL